MVSMDGAYSAYTMWPQAQAITNKIAAVNQAIADGATIGGGSLIINDPVTQAQVTLQLTNLTADESATVFNSMITILTARQTTWNTEIAAIT